MGNAPESLSRKEYSAASDVVSARITVTNTGVEMPTGEYGRILCTGAVLDVNCKGPERHDRLPEQIVALAAEVSDYRGNPFRR